MHTATFLLLLLVLRAFAEPVAWCGLRPFFQTSKLTAFLGWSNCMVSGPCGFSGVVGCPGNGSDLYLSSQDLTGHLPEDWTFLSSSSSVGSLVLASNFLHGTIPATIRTFLDDSGVTKLDLSNNQFSGTIPTYAFASSQPLKQLLLGNNQLMGDFATVTARMGSLTVLELQGNVGIVGTIPNAPLFPSMTSLRIDGTAMYGNLPDAFCSQFTGALYITPSAFCGPFICSNVINGSTSSPISSGSLANCCGNGRLDTGEQCDDGNTRPSDGCGPSCQLENCTSPILNCITCSGTCSRCIDGYYLNSYNGCTICSNGGLAFTQCPYGSQGGYLCVSASSDTQQCSSCRTTSCGMGQFASNNGCDCLECIQSGQPNGLGYTYYCSSGYYASGQLCYGSGSSNSQMCSPCTTSCSVGQYLSGRPCDGYSQHDTMSCINCFDESMVGKGIGYTCQYGQFISGTPCTGAGTTDTQTCTQCYSYQSLSLKRQQQSYLCPPSYWKNGIDCDGSRSYDTQTCQACSYGFKYTCPGGTYRDPTLGLFCDGTGLSDTQLCSACLHQTPCLSTNFEFSCVGTNQNYYFCNVCNGTSNGNGLCDTGTASGVHTQCNVGEYIASGMCKACFSATNGSYVCPEGQFPTGTTCDGTTSHDTQTCTACFSAGTGYSCPAGYWRSGVPCSGRSGADTQICSQCYTYKEPGENPSNSTYRCPPGYFKIGVACNGTSNYDTQTCAPCSGGLRYTCPAGKQRSTEDGEFCEGTGDVDKQICISCDPQPQCRSAEPSLPCVGTRQNYIYCNSCTSGSDGAGLCYAPISPPPDMEPVVSAGDNNFEFTLCDDQSAAGCSTCATATCTEQIDGPVSCDISLNPTSCSSSAKPEI